MKRGLDKTKRINFLNTLIGKNLQVIDIVNITKLTSTKTEYNLSIINSKGVQVEDCYSWYIHNVKAKTLNMVR
jgi:hypothetical protein